MNKIIDLPVILVPLLVISLIFTVGCASAKFEVSQLTITPNKVLAGETFTVSAKISNVGDAVGAYTAVLTINGIERATKDIAIIAGGTDEVSFTLVEDTPGNYAIVLNGMTASFDVIKLPSAEGIVDRVLQSIYDINTYQFDLDMTMNAQAEYKGEAFEANMTLDMSGVCDNLNRRIRAEMIMNMTSFEEDQTEISMEIYLIGNTEYIFIQSPDTEPIWVKSQMPIGTWREIAQAESQIILLESAKVELIGSDEVRGVDCYVLQVTPNLEQLWEITTQQLELGGQEGFDIEEEFVREMFRGMSMKQWIEKDTHFLTKSEINMDLEITPEATGYPGEEGLAVMDITMNVFIYNYNKPFSIELPDGAEEAISLEGTGESEAAKAELDNVQAAVVALMIDNGLSVLPNPVTVATNDMGSFPDTTAAASKGTDPNGNTYDANDKAGFILYQHDIIGGDGSASNGLVNYLVSRYTLGTYAVDQYGTVIQVTTGYE